MTIDRDAFARRFAKAVARAREFAGQFLEERLPEAIVFDVRLNASYDAHATAENRLFPEDSSAAQTHANKGLSEVEVLALLWRDGYVPEWVDVMVAGATDAKTIIELTCCGRFNPNEERLYYTWTDVPPFGVKGPVLPPDWVEGETFSIHHRTICWSPADFARVTPNAAKVWLLELHGPAFDDAVLLRRFDFPKLEVLDLQRSSVVGHGLAALERAPSLRHLTITFDARPHVDFGSLPTSTRLESLTLRNVPPIIAGAARLPRAFARLSELTLVAPHVVESDAPFVSQTVQRLALELPRIPTWLVLPPILRSLSLSAKDADEASVVRLLETCPAALESLSLHGTPVTDAILDVLDRFGSLRYVDLANTRVTQPAVDRFAQHHARAKVSPKPRK